MTSSESTGVLEERTEEAGGRDAVGPSAAGVVFGSLFTPTWSLGLLLFATFFLPFVRSCEGQPPDYPYEVVALHDYSAQSFWSSYFFAAPFFLGLMIALGTLLLAVTRDPGWARLLWWCYSLVLVGNTLLIGWCTADRAQQGEWRPEWGSVALASLVLLAPATARICKTTFNAAMWLQIWLCFGSAVLLSILAAQGELMIGGKLAVTSSVFLVLCSIVQRLDGQRCLTRTNKASGSLQLSLRSSLVLMALGGLACTWVGGFVFADQIAQAHEAARPDASIKRDRPQK